MSSLQRKLSTLTLSSLPRSSSPASSHNARSSTPQSIGSNAPATKSHHSGLRYIFSNSRKHRDQSEMMTSPSSPLVARSSPVISKLTKAFADSLNTTQLSNFLVWILYFDTVELPGAPESWYMFIHNADIQGWIALGNFLAQSRQAGVGHDLDLVVLDSICDRIHLSRCIVHELLIRFADLEQMKYTVVASTIFETQENGCSKVEVLEAVHAKLHEMNRLATNLHPQPGSVYEEQLAMIQKRLRGFLHLVIGPRIANLKLGKPLVTVTTSEHVPKDIQEVIRLNYLYEAIQQERTVPLNRYGSETGSVYSAPPTPSSPSLYTTNEETELARNHAINLMKENHELRTLVAELQSDKNKLMTSNEKLARKLASMGRMQLTGYARSPYRSDDSAAELPDSSLDFVEQAAKKTPMQRVPYRSISASAVPTLHTLLDSESGSPASQYDDVFFRLESSSLPLFELSDPFTIESTTAPPTALASAPQSIVINCRPSQLRDLESSRTGAEKYQEQKKGLQEGRYLSGTLAPDGRRR